MFEDIIDRILSAETFAVVGASRDPEKYGNKVYVALKGVGKRTFAVNPKASDIDGDPCHASLDALPEKPDVAVFIVPPALTASGMAECARLGIGQVWLQPGAEPEDAGALTEKLGLSAVYGGPCILVALKIRRR